LVSCFLTHGVVFHYQCYATIRLGHLVDLDDDIIISQIWVEKNHHFAPDTWEVLKAIQLKMR